MPRGSVLVFGVVLAAAMFAAGSLFSACGKRTGLQPGTAGTGGHAGTGAAGSGGQAGTGLAGMGTAGTGAAGTGASDGGTAYPISIDGRCVAGAFARDGVCACQPEMPLVCGAGCSNPSTDNDNCGGCDNRCGPTSTCVAGACSPTPVTVVPPAAGCTATVGSLDLGISVAISGTTLFVADAGHGTVTSRPIGGGPTTTLASAEMAPHALAVSGTTVVWIDSVAGGKGDAGQPFVTATLRAWVAGAPSATTLATGANEWAGGIGGAATDGTTVYYSTDTFIKAVPIAGGASETVAMEDLGGLPGALALDGATIAYPTGQNGDVDIIAVVPGTVARCGRTSADAGFELDPALQINCFRGGRGGSLNLRTILHRAHRVFYADGTTIKANDTGPGAVRTNDGIAQSSGGDLRAMAMSDARIYFVHDDVVERTPLLRGSTAQPIARGQKTPSSIAVGATKVFWGNDGDCSVAATDL